MSNILKVMLDTNAILNVFISNRNVSKAELQASKRVWQAKDEGKIVGYISASAMTDVFYDVGKNVGLQIARQAVRSCLQTLRICTVDYSVLKYADDLPGPDFEDNLQIACALRYGIGIIVTRDKAFYKGLVSVLTPEQLLKRI